MLEFDEWDELLTNDFTALTHCEGLRDHGVTDGAHKFSRDDPDLPEALNSHPLHNPYSGKDDGGMESMMGVTRPRLSRITRTLSEEDPDSPTITPDDSDSSSCHMHEVDDIIHIISPGDSLAAVALRYGVSPAAIRHANQLWPSDPIYIRTQLVIPRHRMRRTKRDATSQSSSISQETHPAWASQSMSTASFSSTLLTARDTILSALPGRISLDSLSSRNSINENLELDDLPHQQSCPTVVNSPSPPTRTTSGIQSHSKRKYISVHDIPSPLEHDIPPISCQQLRNLTSESTLQTSAFRCTSAAPVFVPVRTSQLEPEPAMKPLTRVKHD